MQIGYSPPSLGKGHSSVAEHVRHAEGPTFSLWNVHLLFKWKKMWKITAGETLENCCQSSWRHRPRWIRHLPSFPCSHSKVGEAALCDSASAIGPFWIQSCSTGYVSLEDGSWKFHCAFAAQSSVICFLDHKQEVFLRFFKTTTTTQNPKNLLRKLVLLLGKLTITKSRLKRRVYSAAVAPFHLVRSFNTVNSCGHSKCQCSRSHGAKARRIICCRGVGWVLCSFSQRTSLANSSVDFIGNSSEAASGVVLESGCCCFGLDTASFCLFLHRTQLPWYNQDFLNCFLSL